MFLISCGKKSSKDNRSLERLNPDGTYTTILKYVNPNISKDVSGLVKIIKDGDEFKVNIRFQNAPTGPFYQHLHTGSICPQQQNDKNEDGIIDGQESRKDVGSIIVPFDNDLGSQDEGGSMKLEGDYTYVRSTSYYLMLSDLHLIDETINDSIVKLNTNDLPLHNRVVVIYASQDNTKNIGYSDIPIACGKLIRSPDDLDIPETDRWENTIEIDDKPGYSGTEIDSSQSDPPFEEEDHIEERSWWDKVSQAWRRTKKKIAKWFHRGKNKNKEDH